MAGGGTRSTAAPARVNVLGVGISAVDMAGALAVIDRWIVRRAPHYVCVTSVHGVMESQRDDELRRIHNAAGLVTPDGMPLVWLGRATGHRTMDRVYGPDLLLALCEHSIARGYRHYFYGGTTPIVERLVDRLCARLPGLQVAGWHAPPFRALTPAEDAADARRIAESCADVVWVGLGAPKQERWMAAHVGRVGAPVLLGVGAAFDFLSGAKRQAPRWMQRSGLEWAFRMATEPRRLAGRYLRSHPAFVWHAAGQALGVRRYSLGREGNGRVRRG